MEGKQSRSCNSKVHSLHLQLRESAAKCFAVSLSLSLCRFNCQCCRLDASLAMLTMLDDDNNVDVDDLYLYHCHCIVPRKRVFLYKLCFFSSLNCWRRYKNASGWWTL